LTERAAADAGPGPARAAALAAEGAAVAGSVALFAASFPPLGLHGLAWLALVPWLVVIRTAPGRRAIGWSVVWSVAAAWSTGTWLPPAIATYFEQPVWIGHLFFVFVAGTMVVPYYTLFAWCHREIARGSRSPGPAGALRPALPLLGAAAFAAAELLRGRLFTGTPVFIGNPWGLLGYSQVDFPPAVQVASLTGIYGTSFVLAAANVALAELWLARARLARAPRRAAATLVAGVLPGALALGFGAWQLDAAGDARGELVRVAVVQGNLDLGTRWRSDLYGKNLETYLDLTRAALERSRPEIVFWPEAAMTFFVDREPLYRRALGRVLSAGDAELIAGSPRAEGEGRDTRFYNTTWVLDPRGEIRGRYDKEYLVPFTEYFPLRVDFLRRQFGRAREFTHGTPGPPVSTRAGPAGFAVCNEAMLPEVVSRRVSDGAAYLVNPSNDSWLADEQYSEMQFDVVTVRAVEQRRYLVRASTSGPSAVIDPWGRVTVRSEPLTRSVIVGGVRPRTERTLYNRVGDAFGVGCAGVTLVAVLRARRRPRKNAEDDAP